ncbi:MAG: YegP family protein [Gemmatimonadota bacterium]
MYKDGRGRFRWRLKAANNQTIATAGQGYTTKAGCRNAIEVVQRVAASAPIADDT